MGFMTWTNEYDIGVPVIDSQHRKWLELLNNFYDNMNKENVESLLPKLISEAADYGLYHFAEEEKFMLSIGYPNIDEQKKMHLEIASKIYIYKKKVSRGQPLISLTVTNEFKLWFRNHILVEDKKIADYIKTHGTGLS